MIIRACAHPESGEKRIGGEKFPGFLFSFDLFEFLPEGLSVDP